MSKRPSQIAKRPSEIAAERIRVLRKRHGWTEQQLADRLTELGSPMDRVAIVKVESGKRGLPLDEAFRSALALDVAPINLFLPLEDEDVQITPRMVASSTELRSWVVGNQPLPGQDLRTFVSEVPLWHLERQQVEQEQFKREAGGGLGPH